MKIAVYVPWIYQRGGVEKILAEYIPRSKNKFTIFTNNYQPENTFDEIRKMNVIELEKVPINRSYSDLITVSLKIATQKVNLDEYDALLVFSSGFGEFITLKNHKKPVICFCSTPLKVIHDPLTKKEFLKNNIAKKAVFSFFSKTYRVFEKKAWNNINLKICNSEETKKRVVLANLAKSNEAIVINPGVEYSKIKPGKTFKKYFFYPSRFIWHKNFELAINAFKEFSKKNKEVELILAGGLDKKNTTYFDKLKELAKGEKIRFFTDPSEDKMKELYKNSYCVVFTAINEDFGIVPIEAMAYGKPIISVNEGGPKETIINEKTGYLVNRDPIEFAKKMILLANNKSKTIKMGKNARKHTQKYDWKIFTNKMDENILKVVNKRNGDKK